MGDIVVVLCVQIIGDAEHHVVVRELILLIYCGRVSELTSQTCIEQNLDPLL